MKRFLLLAAAITCASLTAAWAQTAPTYQLPSGIITTPSSTGAVPVTGSVATPAQTPASAAPSTNAKPAAASTTKTPANATGATSGATGTASVPDQKVQKVVTQVVNETSVTDEGNGVPAISASLPGLKTQPKLADIGDKLDLVQIVGTSSSTAANGGKRVGIQWTTVTRTDTGQTINIKTPLDSSLRLKGDALPAKTKVTARGDADALYDAIKTLFDDAPPLQTANTSGGGTKKQDAAAPQSGGQPNTQGDVTAKPLDSTEKSDDSSDTTETPTFASTTNGCTIRVDLGQMQAIQQEATTTTLSGKTTQGACEDGMTRYTIQKTGIGCDDVVGDKQAQGQTMLYYVGTDGKPVTVQECQPDAALVYPFVDEPSTCVPLIDFNSGKVSDQVETVYRNTTNVRIVVAPCHPTGDGYDIQTTTDGCTLRDDFTKQQTIQQDRQYYTKAGVQNFISSCSDSTTVYAMQVEACPNIVDSNAMKVFHASRYYIDGPSGKSYRSECAPIDAGTDLLATTNGCETVHYDYPSAEQSRGGERLYYMDAGAPVYLTACQESTTVYKWNFVRNGWQMDDTAMSGTELLEAHIALPAGDTLVSPAAVRPESAVVAYVSQGTQDVANGQPKSYTGCDAYSPTTRSQAYQRPDNTMYTVAIGPGDLAGPVDECTRAQQSQTVFDHACPSGSSSCSPQIKQNVNIAYIVTGGVSQTYYNSTPSCPRDTNLVNVNGQTTGTNWNALQVRTATTLPAGAGGTTSYSAWTTQSYTQASTFTIYKDICE